MSNEQKFKRQRPKRKSKRFLSNAKGFAKKGIYGRGTNIDNEQFSYFINILDAMKAGFESEEDHVIMANNVFEQTKDQEIFLASNQIVCKVLETLIGYIEAEQLERYFQKFADNFRPICSDRYASHVLQKMVEIAFLRGLSNSATKAGKEVDAKLEPTSAKRAKTAEVRSEVQYNLSTEFSAEHRTNCRDFVLRVSKFLLNNLEDFVWDSCANHIMRTCILCLAGVHVPKVAFAKGGAELAKNKTIYTVSEDWLEVLKEFPQRLEMWPQFSDFPYEELTSALLGVICLALKAVDKNLLKHFGKRILTESFLKVDANEDEKKEKVVIDLVEDKNEHEADENDDVEKSNGNTETPTTKINLPKVFEYQTSVVLLETLISVAGAKLLTQLYAMLFAGRIATLAEQSSSNFAVQRLLQNIKEKDDFESVFAELCPQTEELLKIGHTGVVMALTEACLRLGTKQAQMVSALQSALHTVGSDKEKSKHFVRCLLKLKPYEIATKDESTFIHLHGSLILQHLLQYNKPIFIVNIILETAPEQLAAIFNTPNGSHVVDAFLQSKFIGEKSREKFIRQLEGFYVDLAITKHGSRVLEQCYAAAQDNQKARIVKELSEKINLLKSTTFGRILHSKLRVETYKLSAAQWKASLGKEQQKPTEEVGKAAKLFKDILS